MSAGQEVGQIFGDGSGPAQALLRSPTVIIATVGLWGMNIYFFRLFRIDYRRALVPEHEKTDGGGSSASGSRKRLNSDEGGAIRLGGFEDEIEGGGDAESGGVGGGDDGAMNGGGGGSLAPLVPAANGGDPTAVPGGAVPPSPLAGTPSKSKSKKDVSTPNKLRKSVSADGGTAASDESDNSAASAGAAAGGPGTCPTYAITSDRLLLLSFFLLILLHGTSYVWIDVLGGESMGAIFAFYGIVAASVVVPARSNRWVRHCLRIVWRRVAELLRPRCYCLTGRVYQPVPFVDVFFADAMCSLSKVFFDWGMLFHLASHYPEPVPASPHSILIPSACAALPYVIRARQCIVMYHVGKLKNDPKRYQHVLNAIKYSTSLFPICLSAYQKTVDGATAERLEKLLIILLMINSLYAFSWDVVMDWGMMHDPTALLDQGCVVKPPVVGMSAQSEGKKRGCRKACLRPRLRFGVLISTTILATNFVLRFCWMLRFYEQALFSSVDVYVLCTELVEVFRRAIWNLLRVEWENLKQHANHPSYDEEDDHDHSFYPSSNNAISLAPLHPRPSMQR